MHMTTFRTLFALFAFGLLATGCGVVEEFPHYQAIGEMVHERTQSSGTHVHVSNNTDMTITLEHPERLEGASRYELREAYAEIASEAYAMVRAAEILPNLERIHVVRRTTKRYGFLSTTTMGEVITHTVESLR